MARVTTEINFKGHLNFSGMIEARMKRMAASVRAIVREAGQEGESRAKSRIDRIDTGYMRDSVTHIVKGNQYWSHAEFGWLKAYEDYFGYQEHGFRHNRSGNHIPGMYALTDTIVEVLDEYEPKIKAAARSV